MCSSLLPHYVAHSSTLLSVQTQSTNQVLCFSSEMTVTQTPLRVHVHVAAPAALWPTLRQCMIT